MRKKKVKKKEKRENNSLKMFVHPINVTLIFFSGLVKQETQEEKVGKNRI